MGYACPVCETPQQDAEHLANHLAFSAMLGHADHEEWLDDRVPEWGELDPETLGDRVADDAPDAEFPQAFEDTTDDRAPREEESISRRRGRGAMGGETAEILARAEAMTREMVGESEEE